LWVAGKLDNGELLARFGVQGHEGPTAIAHLHTFGPLIVPDVVHVITALNGGNSFEGMTINDPAGAIRAVRDEYPVWFFAASCRTCLVVAVSELQS